MFARIGMVGKHRTISISESRRGNHQHSLHRSRPSNDSTQAHPHIVADNVLQTFQRSARHPGDQRRCLAPTHSRTTLRRPHFDTAHTASRSAFASRGTISIRWPTSCPTRLWQGTARTRASRRLRILLSLSPTNLVPPCRFR